MGCKKLNVPWTRSRENESAKDRQKRKGREEGGGE